MFDTDRWSKDHDAASSPPNGRIFGTARAEPFCHITDGQLTDERSILRGVYCARPTALAYEQATSVHEPTISVHECTECFVGAG